MYNRRKVQFLAENIYILGYAVVNKLADNRLSKVLKEMSQTEEINENARGDDTIRHLLDPADDITETCIVLRQSVATLIGVVRTLTGEVQSLRDKLSELEWQMRSSSDRGLISSDTRSHITKVNSRLTE